MAQEEKETLYTDTFFARQPIFNAKKSVWGYELFYRGSREDTNATFADKDVATLTVIANAIMNFSSQNASGKKVLIHFTRDSLLRDIPLALPAESTVVEVDESIAADQEVMQAIVRLKKEGYSLVVNNFSARRGTEPLLKLANIVFVDFLGKQESEIKALARVCSRLPFQLAAKRVEDLHQFQMAQSLGFVLFQGFFFEKPQVVPGRKLSSNQTSRLMLFRVLEKPDPDFAELARVIETDVSISYRLLAFINSAAFSLTRKVESIKQALVLLGWKQIKSWLWLVILTDIAPEDKASELPVLSAIRGKFLERCVVNHNKAGLKPETLYMLGLFSLLEAMLDLPMSEIAEKLPLDERIKDALCHKKNEFTDWLELARCFESGDWENLDSSIEKLALDPMLVANAYSEALVWAKSFHEQLKG